MDVAQLCAGRPQEVGRAEDGVGLCLSVGLVVGVILIGHREVGEHALDLEARLGKDARERGLTGGLVVRLHADAAHAGIERDVAADGTSRLREVRERLGVVGRDDRLQDAVLGQHGGTFRGGVAQDQDLPLRAPAADTDGLLEAGDGVESHAALIQAAADELLSMAIGIGLDHGAELRSIGQHGADGVHIVRQSVERDLRPGTLTVLHHVDPSFSWSGLSYRLLYPLPPPIGARNGFSLVAKMIQKCNNFEKMPFCTCSFS